MTIRRVGALAGAVLSVSVLVNCGGGAPTSPTPPAPAAPNISNFVSSVSSGGVNAASRAGQPPAAGGGPRVTPAANNNVIAGGSSQVVLTATTAISVVYVFVTNVSGGTVAGFYELTVARPSTQVSVVVNLAVNLTASTFDITYAIGGATGGIGPYSPVPTRVIAAGTGDVQVSASWDALSDVDLHVIDPRGEEIYFANPIATSGGELDLDSNAACNIDRVNNENIRWPMGRAPAGTYTVLLDYWASCGVPQTQYVVRVNVGTSANTYVGTFGPSGNNSRRIITTFQYSGAGRITVAAAPAVASRRRAVKAAETQERNP